MRSKLLIVSTFGSSKQIFMVKQMVQVVQLCRHKQFNNPQWLHRLLHLHHHLMLVSLLVYSLYYSSFDYLNNNYSLQKTEKIKIFLFFFRICIEWYSCATNYEWTTKSSSRSNGKSKKISCEIPNEHQLSI